MQTAVEPNHHIIVNFDVTSDCADWGLLESGISGAKDILGTETLEGIADKGYGNDEEILKCLLNGDTPTVYPNKNQNCRTFKFAKTDDETTPEMLESTDHKTLKKCVAAGTLPNVLNRDDITFEIVPTATPQQFLDKETGEIVSYEQKKAMGATVREKLELCLEPPVQPYFERDLILNTD